MAEHLRPNVTRIRAVVISDHVIRTSDEQAIRTLSVDHGSAVWDPIGLSFSVGLDFYWLPWTSIAWIYYGPDDG